jgi:class 3 adenylate cyclase
MSPKTRYARTSDRTHVAYQVSGSGPVDICFLRAWMGHMEAEWDEPVLARMLRRLESMGRLIRLDRRGMGLSDRITHRPPPSLEERLDDIRAVMDAAGSTRAIFVSLGYATAIVTAFAATYPERTLGIALFNPIPRDRQAPGFPWAASDDEWQAELDDIRSQWATPERAGRWLAASAPSRIGDRRFYEWWAEQERMMGSAQDAITLAQLQRDTDVTDVLSAIHVPTLVMIRSVGPIDRARFVADRIPGARLSILPGEDRMAIAGDTDAVLAEIESFIDAIPNMAAAVDRDRVLSTLLFTDIVRSTELAVELGDRAWGDVLSRHLERSTQFVHGFRGRVVDTAGDGLLATFDGTGRAIRCARAIVDDAATLDLGVRAGLHTGECELVGDRLRGVAVHVASRVASMAGSGEILTTSTVKDLVAGSGIAFEDAGAHRLKGVPDEWRLYRVTGS